MLKKLNFRFLKFLPVVVDDLKGTSRVFGHGKAAASENAVGS